MRSDEDLLAVIDLIYQAVLDAELWPAALIKLADIMGVSQIAMPSFDCRANIFATVAPRFDPDLVAVYKNFWAFREPVLPRAVLRPLGEVYSSTISSRAQSLPPRRSSMSFGSLVAAALLR